MVLLFYVYMMYYLLIRCSASLPYIINVKVNDGQAIPDDDAHELHLNQTFTLHLNSDEVLTKINCFSAIMEPPPVYVNDKLVLNKKNHYYALEKNIQATKPMTDTWKCILYFPIDRNPPYTSFNLSVTIIDKTEAAENSEQVLWVKEDLRPKNSNNNGLDNKSFINIRLHRSKGKVVHTTSTMVEYNKPTTITVAVASNVELKNTLRRVQCFNASKPSQTYYVNETLVQNITDPQIYTAERDLTPDIGTSWTCLLTATSPPNFRVSFNVTIKLIKPLAPALDQQVHKHEKQHATTTPTTVSTALTTVTTQSHNTGGAARPPGEGLVPKPPKDQEASQNGFNNSEVVVYRQPELSVNNQIINTTASDEGETLFNAKGDYWYRDGELTKIKCAKKSGMFMYLEMIFANDTTQDIIFTKRQDELEQTLYVKLTSAYDNSYLKCHITRMQGITYVARLYFYKIIPSSSNDIIPTILINDLNLVPTISNGNLFEYLYEYYNGEKFSISGSMPNTVEWNCLPNPDNTQLQPVTVQKNNISLEVLLQHDDNTPVLMSIDCVIGQITVRLELKPIPSIYPTISGLSLSNTLYRYKQSKYIEERSKMEYKIKYRHPQDKELILTCCSDVTESITWDLNDTEVMATGDKNIAYNNLTKLYMNQMLFKPQKNIKSTTIACRNQNSTEITTAEILFESQKPQTERTPYEESLNGNTNRRDNQELESSFHNEFPLLPILAYIGITPIVVVLVTWLVVSLIKRKRRLDKEEETNINYENLPDHNAGAMATPAQWNTPNNYTTEPTQSENPYTYVTPPENITYSLPRDQRPAEIIYAEVGAQDELKYVSVLPKGQSTQTEYANSQQERNMPEYSQIKPKHLRNNPNCAPQVLPKMVRNDNYAQVLPKTERNKPNGSKYTNVSENQRYANIGNTSDYAEPAYCDPSIINNNTNKRK